MNCSESPYFPHKTSRFTMQSDMAKLSLLLLGLTFWLSLSESRSLKASSLLPREKASREVSNPDKLELTRNLPSKIHSHFARGPSNPLNHILKASSKREFDDDQQQQQDVQSPPESPCEEISRKLLQARELFYGMMDDSIVPLVAALNENPDNIIAHLQLGYTFPPPYIEAVTCVIINAQTAEEIIAALGISRNSVSGQITLEDIEQSLDGIKNASQYLNSDFLVPKLRGFVNMLEAFVKTLQAEGVRDPGPDKFIIPTLKNYYTSEELEELLVGLVDAYGDDVAGLIDLTLATEPGFITPEILKRNIPLLARAFIDADSPEEVGTALGFRLTPVGAQVLDAIVRFVLTLPDEAFEMARLLVDIVELTLDNMVLIQPASERK